MHIVLGVRLGELGKSTQYHKRRRGGRTRYEMRRAAPESPDHGRDNGGVKTVLDRKPRDEGVGHGLGHRHNRHGEAGYDIRPEMEFSVPPYPGQERKQFCNLKVHGPILDET